MTLARHVITAAVAGCTMGSAGAQMMPPPENVVSLSASAVLEVQQDTLTVVFSTQREGPDAGPVQTQLKQALDAALVEARKVARPDQVEVRTGGFSMHPRYTPKGGVNGWTGSTTLIVEGRDMAAIAQLTGRIASMSIASVGQSLSRQAREQVEGQVMAQAIERFRARAGEAARQFGFSGYVLREVNLASGESGRQPPMMRAEMSMAKAADVDLPVEAGKASVSASVSGSVQLTK